jgi:hypothetical protein
VDKTAGETVDATRVHGKDLGGVAERSANRFAFLHQPWMREWAPVPLRLIVGYGFMEDMDSWSMALQN